MKRLAAVAMARSKLLLLAFFFCAGLPALLRAAHTTPSSDAIVAAQARSLVALYDLDVARYLYGCPAALVLLTLATSYVSPFLMLLLSFDCVSGMVGDGACPPSLSATVMGKAAAVWGVFCAVALAIYASTCLVLITKAHENAAHVLAWGAKLYLLSCVVAAAYGALWVLVSATLPTPRQTLLAGAGAAVGLGLLHAILRLRMPSIAHLMPEGLDQLLLAGRRSLQWRGIMLTCAWCAASLAGAIGLARRRYAG